MSDELPAPDAKPTPPEDDLNSLVYRLALALVAAINVGGRHKCDSRVGRLGHAVAEILEEYEQEHSPVGQPAEPEWMKAPCKSCGLSARGGSHATDLGSGHDYEP